MAEKTLLEHLEEKKVDLDKMIEGSESFVADSYGSSGLDGGCLRYRKEQIRILLNSVPSVFPYNGEFAALDNLNPQQKEILGEINRGQGCPLYMRPFNIHPIIRTATVYARL